MYLKHLSTDDNGTPVLPATCDVSREVKTFYKRILAIFVSISPIDNRLLTKLIST